MDTFTSTNLDKTFGGSQLDDAETYLNNKHSCSAFLSRCKSCPFKSLVGAAACHYGSCCVYHPCINVSTPLHRYPCPIFEIVSNAPFSYFPIYRYLLRNAWLIELIRLAIPPPACMLLASASSNALCVTEASSVVSFVIMDTRKFCNEERKEGGEGGGQGMLERSGPQHTIQIAKATAHTRASFTAFSPQTLAFPAWTSTRELGCAFRTQRPRTSLSLRSRRGFCSGCGGAST